MKHLDTDTATVMGFWVGLGGFLLGFVGIGLTLYSFYKNQPDIVVLTASGWVASLIIAVAMGLLGKGLVELVSSMSKEIVVLGGRIADLEHEKERLITIGEYLASQTSRTARKKQAAVAEVPQNKE
jgi:hypothetical protein